MAISSPVFKPIIGTGALNIKVSNPILTTAGAEYSFTLSDVTKSVLIKSRQLSEIKLAFATGETATKWVTIPVGCSYTISDIELTGKIFYLSATINSVTMEIVETLT